MSRIPTTADVVIVGGGHNGLVAATYLALAGRGVTVLEKLEQVGGAAVSAQAFDGLDARLSRYSYLVSLFPARIIRDLGLDLQLVRRRYSSYTPLPGTRRGLLVDNADAAATSRSFASIGAGADGERWRSFYSDTARLAEKLFPTVCDPLLSRTEARRLVGDDRLWTDFIDTPIGERIEASFANDLVRGVVLTDGLIGTFASAHDMAANICFLYHVIGGGTGDWDVPVGGMGTVSGALEHAARSAGAVIVTGAEVTAITPDGELTYVHGDSEKRMGAGTVLANIAPSLLEKLVENSRSGTGRDAGVSLDSRNRGSSRPPAAVSRPASATSAPPVEGAQLKVNLLLKRLPRLRDASVDSAAAFGGTFHINETYSQLDRAFMDASAGSIPSPLPAEIYCHTLSDPSILSPELQVSGAHTLTLFGLHVPDRLTTADTNDEMRARLQRAAIDTLDSVLGEEIEPLLMTDAQGRPAIETKTTRDLEEALGLPGGNIFHAPLSWPFAEDAVELDIPAARWGVATRYERILLCGAGAQRGGGVSGIGGHNAAMAVLEGS